MLEARATTVWTVWTKASTTTKPEPVETTTVAFTVAFAVASASFVVQLVGLV